MNDLTPIPRIKSHAPFGNTIEWEIPDEVSVTLMLIERIGYTFIVKVKQEKKHWWSRKYKTFTISNPDIMQVITKGTDFLEKYGFYIDEKSINLGEIIGYN